jgi:hypothetical protein
MEVVKVKELYEYVAKLMEENKGECGVKLDLLSFAPASFKTSEVIKCAESFVDDREICPEIVFNEDKLYIAYP